MKNIAFPIRKSTRTEFKLKPDESGFEIFTDRRIEDSSIVNLGKKSFNGTVKNHYFVGEDNSSLDDILGNAGIGDFLSENLSTSIRSVAHTHHFRMPSVMAVANATPDSFYPGSRLGESNNLLDALIDANPDIIDVGGESTRPGSGGISVHDEISRIEPVIKHITSRSKVPISLDTRHPEVLEYFAGDIHYINDITGFRDERMVRLAADHSLKCITMHMRGTPADMQTRTIYSDLVPEVLSYLIESADTLRNAGVSSKDIIIDPGIGFSKDFGGNLEILSEIESFSVGYSILVGASRKSFIGKITGEETEGRLPGTLAVTAYLSERNVDIIRVHDPKENIQLLKVFKAITEGRH